MKVFISWSGDRSRSIAEIFKQWLPGVLQAVRPYYTPDDVAKGSRWSTEIAKNLEESRVAIICLTPENLHAPWIMFEAGALAKNLDRSRVTPVLFGLEPTDLTGPLVQFQAAKFSKPDIGRLIKTINTELADAKLADDVLDSVFNMWWPKLETDVNTVLETSDEEVPLAHRPEHDILEEILSLTRSQARRAVEPELHPQAVEDLVEGFFRLITSAIENGTTDRLSDVIEILEKPIKYEIGLLKGDMGKRSQGDLVGKFERAQRLFESHTKGVKDDADEDVPF